MAKSKKIAVIPKNKGGRPRIELTEEQVNEVERMARGMTSEQIADNLGIDRATFYEIMKRDEEVARRYKKGRAALIDSAIGHLAGKMAEGDTTSILFYLKTQAGWREKQDVNISSEDGSLKVPNPVLISFSDDSKKD